MNEPRPPESEEVPLVAPRFRKRVDEDWKSRAEREKSEAAGKEGGKTDRRFLDLLSGLATQALIALGEVPHPLTRTREVRLEEARHAIDTLEVIRRKTQGNLSDEERRVVDGLLAELQMKYVQQGETPPSV